MRTKKVYSAAIILAMIVSMIFAGCAGMDPEMKISIDGKEFMLDCKVQDFIDAGFSISSINHQSEILSESDYPVIDSMIMDQTNYYLISEGGIPCDVAFNVYNDGSSNLDLSECKVYQFKYDAGTYAEYANSNIEKPEVLFNGVDCRFTDCAETANALNETGFRFSSDDIDAFSADDMYGTSVIGPSGLMGHNVSLFHDYDYTEGVVRTNGFEFSLKLDYEIK
ncbi:MAG: hypothetical protein J6127_03680 [Clostridiales bacterium]|nr:hypothetical protein [Clostridiales bacterium]